MLLRLTAVLSMLGLICIILGCSSGKPAGYDKNQPTLTIVWAQWDPADVLKTMAREWGERNGVNIKTTFIPWPQFQDKIFTEFAARNNPYDIVIGDSQWLGKGVVEEHYLELTDWMKQELNLDSFEPSALSALCEYPVGSGRYYAAPCQADAIGFSYRKDLFEDPKERSAFEARYGRPLGVPATWQELYEIAEFFHRPQQKLNGVALFTDSGQYDAITMGFQQVMWAFGGAYFKDDYVVKGVVNSPQSVAALEFYKKLCQFTPPGSTNYYHQECLNAQKTGSVAMAMNFFAVIPSLTHKDTNPDFWDKTGYFAIPTGPAGRFASLGGQGFSIMKASSPQTQELAKNFIKWFLEPERQKHWAMHSGCFSASKAALSDPEVLKASPLNPAFAESVPLLRDFYNIPEFAELLKPCQQHWNAALVGKKTCQEAMDAVAKEHDEILKKYR